MTSNSSSPIGPRWRLFAAAAAVVLLVLLLFIGLPDRDAGKNASRPSESPRGAVDADLRRQLTGTLDGLEPERFGVTADVEGIVDDLNLWWLDYKDVVDPSAIGGDTSAVRRWFGPDAAAHAASERFDARDAGHVRNALLFRDIAESIGREQESDLDRATAAFSLVTRQVTLRPSSASAPLPPLTAFEVLLLGRGVAADRVWIFAEILRQLGIDSVLLTASEGEAAGTTGLVAAILPEHGVSLFDPELGLPIPSTVESRGADLPTPATLTAARDNDALLRQFDVPGGPAYPWTAAALRTCTPHFISASTYSAPRIAALQLSLPAEYAATVSDHLGEVADSPPGLDLRVKQAGADGLWAADAMRAWDYPERQTLAFHAAGGEQDPKIAQALSVLRGPRIMRKHSVGQGLEVLVETDSSRPLRFVRIQHLRGELGEALANYGVIRATPIELASINVVSREEAVYWIGVVQLELERFPAAVSTLELYQRDYPAGVWAQPARLWQATALARDGNTAAARELLTGRNPSVTGPAALRDSYLSRRWQTPGGAADAGGNAGTPQ